MSEGGFLSPREMKEAAPAIQVNKIIGNGGSTSANIGAPIVNSLPTNLMIPVIVESSYVGKNSTLAKITVNII